LSVALAVSQFRNLQEGFTLNIADIKRSNERHPRILVATNQFFHLSGSEVVALEVVEYFAARGCHVTFYSNLTGSALASSSFKNLGRVRVVDNPADIQPFTYDMVYAQHQVLGLFNYEPSILDVYQTSIFTGRLSRKAYLESGGWLHDRILGDHVLANSELTAEHLNQIGHPGPITNFRNAAPESFFRLPVVPKRQLRRALVVTNHGDAELMKAIAILRQSIEVEHVGRSGSQVKRITPQLIASADIIVSIGKTIPYGSAGRVPVYVYDHFGGPGYLDEGNFDLAARFNFTGRCCNRKLSATDIASDVMDRFYQGVSFANDISRECLETFYLPTYLNMLAEPQTRSNAEKRQEMRDNPFLTQERMLASYVRNTYRDAHWRLGKIKELQRTIATLRVHDRHP